MMFLIDDGKKISIDAVGLKFALLPSFLQSRLRVRLLYGKDEAAFLFGQSVYPYGSSLFFRVKQGCRLALLPLFESNKGVPPFPYIYTVRSCHIYIRHTYSMPIHHIICHIHIRIGFRLSPHAVNKHLSSVYLYG